MDKQPVNYRGAALFVIVLAVLFVCFLIVRPFIPAILWAVVLSVLMAPFYKRIHRRYSENFSAFLTTLLSLAFIGIPLILVATALYIQAAGMLRKAADEGKKAYTIIAMAEEIDKMLKPISEKVGMNEYTVKGWVEDNEKEISDSLRTPIRNAAMGIARSVFTAIVAFLTMFFMLRDGHRLRKPVQDLLPIRPEKTNEIIGKLGQTIHAVFIGVVLVAMLQGTLAGIAYAACGVPHPVMWGAITVVLCIIPLVGSPVVYIPLSVSLMMQGKLAQGLILLAVCLSIVSNIDNVLRPFLIGARTNLHPIAIFFSLLGGVLLFGPVGIMVGPMFLTIGLAISEVMREINAPDVSKEAV